MPRLLVILSSYFLYTFHLHHHPSPPPSFSLLHLPLLSLTTPAECIIPRSWPSNIAIGRSILGEEISDWNRNGGNWVGILEIESQECAKLHPNELIEWLQIFFVYLPLYEVISWSPCNKGYHRLQWETGELCCRCVCMSWYRLLNIIVPRDGIDSIAMSKWVCGDAE